MMNKGYSNQTQKAVDEGKKYNELCEKIESDGFDSLSSSETEFVISTRKQYMEDLRKQSTANYLKYKFVGESESAGIELVVDNLKSSALYKLEHNDVVKECFVLLKDGYADIRSCYEDIKLGEPLTIKYVTTAYNSIFNEDDGYKKEYILPTSKNETIVNVAKLIYKSITHGTGGNF